MARFWVGDLHFGHLKVARIRYPGMTHEAGFDDKDVVFEHDHQIMKQLKSLDKNDQVWILGDISSGKPEEEARALNLLSDISAQLHLIAGNHDSVAGIHRNGYKHQRRWLDVFESVQDYTRVRLYGRNVLMSHYPYARSGDGPGRGEARYLEWRLPDTGLGLIHAHTHHTEPHMPKYRIDWDEKVYDGLDTQQICVSWDVRRGLTTEQQLSEWASTLPK